jgi:hypothetical protein
MKNKKLAAGRIILRKAQMNSRDTFPEKLSGKITAKSRAGGVQYHELKNEIKINPKTKVSFVKGFK